MSESIQMPKTVLSKALDRAMQSMALDSEKRAKLKNLFFAELKEILEKPIYKTDVPKNTL